MRPEKNAIIACGANKHAAKVFSVDTGNMLLSLSEMDPIIATNPLVTVDTMPQGKVALIGSSNGQIHVKNITLTHELP